MSNGRIDISLLPVGAVVNLETRWARSKWVSLMVAYAAGYFSGKDPAFGLIGNMVDYAGKTQHNCFST